MVGLKRAWSFSDWVANPFTEFQAIRTVRSKRRHFCAVSTMTGIEATDHGAFAPCWDRAYRAIDDLDRLRDITKAQEIWFHIDGAFGGSNIGTRVSTSFGSHDGCGLHRRRLHKWFYLPFDIGCLLVRDESKHLSAFASSQAYMQTTDRGLLAGGVPLADRGVELTRSFRALKAWMCIRAYGIQRFADCIESNIEQARELARRIDRNPRLERLAPVPLNIVCFRYVPLELQGVENSADLSRMLDLLNQELLLRLQEGGVAVLSSTWLNGNSPCEPRSRITARALMISAESSTKSIALVSRLVFVETRKVSALLVSASRADLRRGD